jgi:hypothetical protein
MGSCSALEVGIRTTSQAGTTTTTCRFINHRFVAKFDLSTKAALAGRLVSLFTFPAFGNLYGTTPFGGFLELRGRLAAWRHGSFRDRPESQYSLACGIAIQPVNGRLTAVLW